MQVKRCYVLILGLLLCFNSSCNKKEDSESSLNPDPLVSCALPPTSSQKNNIQVSWSANKEKAVNQAGGGYRVYYCSNSGYSLSTVTTSYVDVNYVSGTTAPVTVLIPNLDDGTYFIKVVAFSALNPPGGSSGSTSLPSAEFSITVP